MFFLILFFFTSFSSFAIFITLPLQIMSKVFIVSSIISLQFSFFSFSVVLIFNYKLLVVFHALVKTDCFLLVFKRTLNYRVVLFNSCINHSIIMIQDHQMRIERKEQGIRVTAGHEGRPAVWRGSVPIPTGGLGSTE